MESLGQQLSQRWDIGDVVLLSGPLGAGKTTLVRGILHGLGYTGIVRSPTYNLVQTFDTDPPSMHADLYRVQSPFGIGLEDYLSDFLCLIEWPDRLGELIDPASCWNIEIAMAEPGRTVRILEPERG